MKKTTFFLFVFLAALAVLAGCQTKDAVPPLSASLSELSGLVETLQAGQDGFSMASKDTVLEVNGQVRTGDDGRVRLDLSSGTIIRVSPASLFTLTSNDEVEGGLLTQLKLEAGKVFIILNGGQADVETPSGVASVKGSYLSVQVEDGKIVITCLEGTCSMNGADGDVILIPPGYKMTFIQDPETGEWRSPLLELMSPEDFQEWLDNNPEAKELFEQGIASLTALAQTETATEEATEAPTEVPPTEVETVVPSDDSSSGCSLLEEPTDGSALNKIGQVNFGWSEQPGAGYYVITFVNADGSRARLQTTTNNAAFYIEVLPAGGSYQWFVTAYAADGSELCTSNSATFSKPQADPTEKPAPTEDPNATEEAQSADCSAATLVDFCDANSPCFDQSYVDSEACYCIVDGVDICQQP